jgi:invasion protein IalB
MTPSAREIGVHITGKGLAGRLTALGLAVAAMLLLAPVGALRAEQAKPQNVQFKSWTLSCVTPEPAAGSTTKPKTVCGILHVVPRQDEPKKVEMIVTSQYMGQDRTLMMVLTLRPVTNLQRGVNFQIDKGAVYKAKIQSCSQAACIAQFKLSDDLLKLLRTGTEVTFAFGVNPEGQASWTIPLAGFAAAMDALQKTGS